MIYNKIIFKRCFPFKGKEWYKNLKEIPLYFKLMHRLTKCGYDEYGNWMTYAWFITVMKEILPHYKLPNYSPSIMFSEATWENAINTMLNLLDAMDENNYDSYDEEKYQKMNFSTYSQDIFTTCGIKEY